MTGKLLARFGLAAVAAPVLMTGAALANEPGHPIPGQIGLQTPVTPIMDSIVAFHDGILLWTAGLITLLVLVLLVVVMLRFNARANPTPSRTTHNTLIEIVWTVVPILVLIIIAIPSFAVLTDQMTVPDGERKYLGGNIFSMGEVAVPAPALTVKVTGVSWNWNYEYVDQGLSFDSFILTEEERLAQEPPQPRQLAVNNFLVVPVDATVRVQVTAAPTDVIHAFAVPSFGIKVDAVPGRLNETWFNARRPGVYYGQCSELCGKDHAFMPIGVRVVSQPEFDAFMAAFESGGIDAANAALPPVSI